MTYSQEFTFFDAPGTSGSAIICPGRRETRDSTSGQDIAYSVHINRRNIAVYGPPPAGGQVLLAGSLDGVTKSYASLSGIGGVASARKEGHFRGAWSFTDFNGNAYRWDVKVIRNQYRLYDSTNKEIAFFERTPRKAESEGILRIQEPISEDLLPLIMLTIRLVHNRSGNSEQSSTNS